MALRFIVRVGEGKRVKGFESRPNRIAFFFPTGGHPDTIVFATAVRSLASPCHVPPLLQFPFSSGGFDLSSSGRDISSGSTGIGSDRGGGIPERRPDSVGFVFKPVTFSIVFEARVSKYRKDEGGSRYLETESVANLSSGWQVGQDGKFVPAPGAAEEHSIPFVDSSFKLIRNGETLFAKIESGYPALSEPGGIVLKFSGIYELSLLAGNWEEYEKGEVLKVTISSQDQERYLGDLSNMYRDPEFLKWHAT
jgi:hypothetical protein